MMLRLPILGQVAGEVSAEPSTAFFSVVPQHEEVSRQTVLRSKRRFTIRSCSISPSLSNALVVLDKSSEDIRSLEIVLKPQSLAPGQQRDAKVEGFVRVVCALGGSAATDEEVIIPVIAFISAGKPIGDTTHEPSQRTKPR